MQTRNTEGCGECKTSPLRSASPKRAGEQGRSPDTPGGCSKPCCTEGPRRTIPGVPFRPVPCAGCPLEWCGAQPFAALLNSPDGAPFPPLLPGTAPHPQSKKFLFRCSNCHQVSGGRLGRGGPGAASGPSDLLLHAPSSPPGTGELGSLSRENLRWFQAS